MKIFGIGKNYLDHAKEFDGIVPEKPVVFMKPDTALTKGDVDFFHPSFSSNIHFEVEIVIRICKEGKSIKEDFAKNYYDELAIGIDFTARDIQTELKSKGLPWTLAKGFNGSAPISKFFPVSDFELNNLNFSLEQNGKEVQKGNTKNMLFSIDKCISFISEYFTLKTGDLIFTGTPAGVGPIAIDDKLECYLEDNKALEVSIK